MEYLGTTMGNLKNTQGNRLSIIPLYSSKSSPLFFFKSFIDFDLFDFNNLFVQEKFRQSQAAQIHSLSQNVNKDEIISSSQGVTTKKSCDIHQKFQAKLKLKSKKKTEKTT